MNVWSSASSRPWSWPTRWMQRLPVRVLRHGEDRRDVEPVTPSSGRPPLAVSSASTWPIISSIVRNPSCGHELAHLLGDELEEVDDELGLAAEALAQLGVLGGDADRARVEVADAHHHAARHDERRGGEAELLGAEQRRDDDVAAGLHLAVGLHDDAVAQAVEQQRLLRLGEAELPRPAGVLQRRQRAGARCRRRGRRSARRRPWPSTRRRPRCRRPTSATSLTCTRAAGLAFLRSWISCLRSSIE